MTHGPLQPLLALQCSSGAFPSRVGEGADAVDDETCFVTAQVALLLGTLLRRADTAPLRPRLAAAREAALDFVEACEDPTRPGAFRFYPYTLNTPRLPIHHLPADADDTALAWLALLDGGRRSNAQAHQALATVMEPARLLSVRGGDGPWVRAGAVRTWLVEQGRDNPVDLCVNANVAALRARVGWTQGPLHEGVTQTVAAGVRITGGSAAFLRSATPFYAHGVELLHAVERAVVHGAASLLPALATLRAAWGDADTRHPAADQPLYCNSHGRPIWRSPGLQLARRCAAHPPSPERAEARARHLSEEAVP